MSRATPRSVLIAWLVAASLASAGCSSLIGVPEVPDAPDSADDGGGGEPATPADAGADG
jgi:hypothetical protein